MRPGYLNGWALGEVTGDQIRRDRQLGKKLRALAKTYNKLAAAEDRLAALTAKQNSIANKLAGWLGSWF